MRQMIRFRHTLCQQCYANSANANGKAVKGKNKALYMQRALSAFQDKLPLQNVTVTAGSG